LTVKTLDLKKEHKQLYSPPSKKVEMVDVPKMNFLMIDGQGDPNRSPLFQEAIEALYSLSYTIKFTLKKSDGGIDYKVMPLEGLWWTDEKEGFSFEKRSSWKWTLMIMQPDFVTKKIVKEAVEGLEKKKNHPALLKIRFESYYEGKAAQTMHIGPFSTEEATVSQALDFIKDLGRKLREKLHEIYISDFRRVAPEKMKTIIRQPME